MTISRNETTSTCSFIIGITAIFDPRGDEIFDVYARITDKNGNIVKNLAFIWQYHYLIVGHSYAGLSNNGGGFTGSNDLAPYTITIVGYHW